jgi:hypothetical protein
MFCIGKGMKTDVECHISVARALAKSAEHRLYTICHDRPVGFAESFRMFRAAIISKSGTSWAVRLSE